MSFRKNISILLLSLFLLSCTTQDETPVVFPTYDPFLPVNGTQQPFLPVSNDPTHTMLPTATRPPTPTRAPVNISPLIGIQNQIVKSPTPDPARILPTPRQDVDEYIVQAGDTLGDIAQRYGISLQALLDANNITDPNLLEVGMVLVIPAPNPLSAGSALKIIPDSELVYGPGTVYFDVADFIAGQNGYLASYTQDVNGILMSGTEIVQFISANYSVNPRILLALLEYQSGWVTNSNPINLDYPMGFVDENRYGLYRQLAWAANTLNRGYYLWRVNALSTWVLADGQVVPVDPTINAGTAAVQYFFSQLDNLESWEKDVKETGLAVTYYVFFGNPFSYAVEPLVPPSISQPLMNLPFSAGESWYFTGGPHGGWDSGSAWAALDFAPPDNTGGNCLVSPFWVTAMADGYVVRASNGAVVQDLDNDGYEQTGWVILYMHVAEEDRVQPGEYLFANEYVGHPSCEGGVSNATHVHVARKYNGEWIAADGAMPFNLSGWISSGDGYEYDGFLTRGSETVEAWDSANDFNLVTR
ncbi:MAG: LysM peptidoglycan-binding domain-containing protein [Chloroflexi bacterium]|nr:LysM peptidoglycan-binding domain-containing protein [Chloroflexota bacterium]